MASQFAILTSVKRTPTVSRVLLMHLVKSKKTGYKLADFTATTKLCPTMWSWKAAMSQRMWQAVLIEVQAIDWDATGCCPRDPVGCDWNHSMKLEGSWTGLEE